MKEFLTVKDIAQRYGITVASVYNHVNTGKLPQGFYLGRSHRWSLKELEKWETIFQMEAKA